ncbi:MAG: hypothetical protein NVS3B20_19620 [Polyangiales bacterium]
MERAAALLERAAGRCSPSIGARDSQFAMSTGVTGPGYQALDEILAEHYGMQQYS